jgi:transposase-like protein
MFPVNEPSDRRATARPAEPHCPACNEDMTQITLRTSMQIYYRCIACRHMWTALKSGTPATGPALVSD